MGDLVQLPARDHEPWITKAQLCQHLGVTPRTIERWVDDGMPCLKLGDNKRSRIRFKLTQVESWLGDRAA